MISGGRARGARDLRAGLRAPDGQGPGPPARGRDEDEHRLLAVPRPLFVIFHDFS